MMLTIHGLPLSIKYHDLKALIKQECKITDFILDNLVGDGDSSKKVRIGVADETEGAHLSKCLNGFRMGGNALRVMPVGKMGSIQAHGNMDQPRVPIPRNDMAPHPGNFGNQLRGAIANQPVSWNSGPNLNNQWRPNQPYQTSMPQNNFGFQQAQHSSFTPQQQSGPFNQNRPMQNQAFGYRAAPSQVTINKNHFQGATQFHDLQKFSSQGQGQTPNWNNPIQQQKPQFEKPNISFESDKRPMAMGKVRFSPRRSPPPARRPSPGRRMSPGKRMSPRRLVSPGKRMSPRRLVSPGKRMSPRRLMSPGKRMSPRRLISPGKRMSPGRRTSPGRRRSPIPGDKRPLPRRDSPLKRLSPSRRLVSPVRFSPPRRHPDKNRDDFARDGRSVSKQIRPAYEPEAKTANQAPYPGGYRPSIHENVQYPIIGARKIEQQGTWGQDRDKPLYSGQGKIPDDARRDVRMSMGGRGMDTKGTDRLPPMRKSRSPMRKDIRDRSPIKDRYKRHSPSPRSPRRSWALEKRQSPEINDAPPPPTWPGQNPDGSYPRSAANADDRKHAHVWEHKSFEETEDEMRRERRPYGEEQRTRRDAERPRGVIAAQGNHREPSPKRTGFKPNDERFPLQGGRFEPRDPKFESRDLKFAPRDPKFDTRDPKFEQRDPKFGPRDPKFDPRVPKFEPRDPKFEPRDPKFEPRDSKFEPRDPKFEPRDPKFEPRDPKFEPRGPKFEPRDPKFEPRDPKFEPRDPKFDPRDPKFEPRDPKFEPRDPKFEPRDPKFEPRFEPRGSAFDSKFEPHTPNVGARDQKFDREPKFEPRSGKYESREPVFEPRDHKFEPRDSRFDSRDHKFELRDRDKFPPRDPTFEQRESRFEARDSKYPMRGHEFEPRDPKFESRGPNFEPRDPKFDTRDPTFEQRSSRFEPRDPKFQTRDGKFKPTFEPLGPNNREPQFEPRDPKFEARGESKYEPRNDYKDQQGYRRNSPERKYPGKDYREYPTSNERRPEDVVRKAPEDFQKEFDDIYKRTVEFKQKVQELRKAERNREPEYSRDDRGWEIDRADRRHIVADRSREFSKSPGYDEDRSSRHGDRPRHAEDVKHREPEWTPREITTRKTSPSPLNVKRNKAVKDIATEIMKKFANFEMSGDIRTRVFEELKFTVYKILRKMFGDRDVSYIELTVKFNSQHDEKEQIKMLEDVLSSFPTHLQKKLKRSMQDLDRSKEIPAKSAKYNPELLTAGDPSVAVEPQIPEWNVAYGQQGFVSNLPVGQFEGVSQMIMNPVMVPSPFGGQEVVAAHQQDLINIGVDMQPNDGFFNLYLCKDDFKPFTDIHAELLRQFLVSEMFSVTERSQGWAPEFTLKGLQSMFRYEIQTYDVRSKDWLLNLDFSGFPVFDVLVYTKEELWYERAAIWLPGHSRCRNIEPLDKLKLQNSKLDDVVIGKWKLVKKIVNAKGTRIYVDIPPSAARALEKHKMMLSYELQKVNVFLKTVAVDKDAFDAGLSEQSVTDQAEIVAAAQSSPMPALKEESGIVKISLKGAKTLTIIQARKIKEMIIYQLFKYHQQDGSLKTDFVKYGLCSPNSLGILPENPESKRWLTTIDIGKLNRMPIIILGRDNINTRYLKMYISVPGDHICNAAVVTERLKSSNQGVKGINFNLWKPITPDYRRLQGTDKKSNHKSSNYPFEVEVDLESAEAISKMKFQLDYVDDRHRSRVANFKPQGSTSAFLELIEKYKSELRDSYDVANMDIASSDSDEEVVSLSD